MNAELLLAHYERIADAPDAIARLRRFILDLAVRGKLVPQDPNDEPAVQLLKRIGKEKARLVNAGDARKSDVDPVASNEEPFLVPTKWTWTRLGSIGDWGSGSTPSRGNSALYGGGIPWLKSGELNDNRHLAGSEETVTKAAIASGSFRLNRPGDVLIAMYGATIGKVAILAEEAVTNQAVCGCTPFAGVSNQFLFIFLLSQREQFHAASEGGAQPNISKIKIIWTPFPLPPLAEQHRIVAKVDELMALCDRLETARTEREAARDRLTASTLARLNTPDPATFPSDARFALDTLEALTTRSDQIQQLRQTIFNLAVQGELVLQTPTDEPAVRLLERIAREKFKLIKERKLKPQKELLPIDKNDIPFEIPNSWTWAKAENVFLNITDGFHNTPTPVDVGRPYITAKHIRPNKIDFDNCLYVDEKSHGELIAKTRVRKGDILIVNIGAGSGTPAIIDVDFEFSFKNVAIVNLPAEMDGNFILIFLLYYRNIVFDELIKGGAQPFLGLGMLREMMIPLPPLPEQRRIVAKVDALMALCDQLEASLTATAATRRRLLDALLAEALAPAEINEEAA